MRTIFRITTVFIVVLAILTLIYYLLNNFIDFNLAQPIISIGWAIAGIIWAISGIILNWTTLRNRPNIKSRLYKPNNSKDVKYINNISDFINRKVELNKILKNVNEYQVINVFGHKGSGKSEILKLTCDIINGFHKREIKKRFSNTKYLFKRYNCYYSDLDEVAGATNLFSQISNKAFGEELSDASNLAYYIKKKFGSKRVIFILDNISSLQAGVQVLGSVLEYLRIRDRDKFLIGSVGKILDVSRIMKYTEIKALNDKGIIEYLNAKFRETEEFDIEKIKFRSRGLPIFLNLLIVESESRDRLPLNLSIENYLTTNILNSLPEEARRLLVFLSYFNLTSTTVKPNLLINFPLNDIDLNLDLLRRYSTIIDIPSKQIALIKVHDLIRDLVIKQSKSEQQKVNESLYKFYSQINDKYRSTLHWLLTSRNSSSYEEIIALIHREIILENYPYLAALWDIFNRNREAEHLSSHDLLLQQTVLYGYVRALLATGDYKGAESLLHSSQFGKTSLPDLRNIKNEIEFDYHLSLADLDHLLNRYHQAYEVTEILLSIAIKNNFSTKEIECKWLLAHLMGGHFGIDLKFAINLYDSCLEREGGDLNSLISLKCKNGIFALTAAMNDFSDDFETEIAATIDRGYQITGAEGVVSSLLRNKARYYRRKGNFELSKNAVNQSLELAKAKRLRTIFNCYLAYGDLNRFQNYFEKSIANYKTVIDFTNENGDEHLKSSAIGGILISEICFSNLLFHENWEQAKINLILWINKVDNLGLEITKLRLEIILLFLEINEINDQTIISLIKRAQRFNLNYEEEILLNRSQELFSSMEMHIH